MPVDPHVIQIYLQDDVLEFIDQIPKGRRSAIINNMLRAYMLLIMGNENITHSGGLVRVVATTLKVVVDLLKKLNFKVDKLSA